MTAIDQRISRPQYPWKPGIYGRSIFFIDGNFRFMLIFIKRWFNMRLIASLLITGLILTFAGTAGAIPLTSFGNPVDAIGSPTAAIPNCPTLEGVSCFNTSTGSITFFIPLSSAYTGVFGVTNVGGGNTAGTVSDTGSGQSNALTMYLSFTPVAVPAQSASLQFFFTDLDLRYVNDPNGFFETVRFYDRYGSALSPLIWRNGQSGSGTFPYTVTGNSTSQTITFSDVTSIVQNPFYVRLRFGSNYGDNRGRNTPERLIATLTSEAVAVPEPSTWLLLGSGLVGLALIRRRLD